LSNLDAMNRKGVSLHMIDLGGEVTGTGIAKLVFAILSADHPAAMSDTELVEVLTAFVTEIQARPKKPSIPVERP
jgi:hypothetical protein